MTRRFWISVALAVPLLALMVSKLFPSMPLQHILAARTWAWIEFALASPVVLWCGWPFFVRGWQSVVNRHLNMFTLIALGTGGVLPLQRRGYDSSPDLSSIVSCGRWRDRALLRACGRHHCAGPAGTGDGTNAPAVRPAVLFVRCWVWLRRLRGRLDDQGGESDVLLDHVQVGRPAAGQAGREGPCRWRGAGGDIVRLTSPWSAASQFPSRKMLRPKSPEGTVNGTGGFVMRG